LESSSGPRSENCTGMNTARASDITLAWNLALPNTPVPQEYWLNKLCAFPDSAVERGLNRAARKFARTNASPDEVARYARSVARNSTKDEEWERLDTDPASRW
jgi:hypothetical protein